MEISRNPSKYLPMMLLFIHRHYILNYPIFYDQWALSKQSVFAIYIYFTLTVARNRKFLMLIVSLATEQNQFLNRGISFSLRKSTRGNIYIYMCEANTEFTHFAFSQDSCRSTHQLIVHFFSLNPG